MISLGVSGSKHLSDLKKSYFSSGLLDYIECKLFLLHHAVTYVRIREKEKKEKTKKYCSKPELYEQ